MEEWRIIEGFDGVYSVSNYGKVRNNKTGRIMKQGFYVNGYLGVSLQKDGKGHRCRVHRLVAIAFIPNPNNYPQINHKDENKTNNHADNLEWCTPSYNENYGTRSKRLAQTLGHKVIAYDLKGNKVGEFESIIEGARQLGCDEANIRRCLKGIYKSTKGYKWQYAI